MPPVARSAAPGRSAGMKVLVTGAGGFIGSWVVRALRSRGHEVRAMLRPGRDPGLVRSLGAEAVEADLLDEPSLRRASAGAEGLVHCAAHIGFWSRRNDEQRRVNVDGTAAVLRAAHGAGVTRIVHVSSVAAVGARRRPEVMDEDSAWNGFDIGIHYAITKREGEE